MWEGKSFNIYNFTDGDLIINDIENEGYGLFHWYIDPWTLTLPYTMAFSDTIPLNVKISIPLDSPLGQLVVDTLDILTENGHHKVIIKVDSDLLSSLTEPKSNALLCRIESIVPNPFNSMTRISFSLNKPQKTSLTVYNLQGQAIIVLADQVFSATKHEIIWDRKDKSGNEVNAGIYLVKLSTKGGIDFKKLIVSF
jgi:hypothetical protein